MEDVKLHSSSPDAETIVKLIPPPSDDPRDPLVCPSLLLQG